MGQRRTVQAGTQRDSPIRQLGGQNFAVTVFAAEGQDSGLCVGIVRKKDLYPGQTAQPLPCRPDQPSPLLYLTEASRESLSALSSKHLLF